MAFHAQAAGYHHEFLIAQLQFELSEARRALDSEERIVEALLDPEWRPLCFETDTLMDARERYVTATRSRRSADSARRTGEFEQLQLFQHMQIRQ